MASTRPPSPEEWEALKECYLAQENHLYKTAMAAMQSEHLARDVLQDTLCDAADHIDAFMESKEPAGWLYKKLTNTIKHAKRSQERIMARYVPFEDAPSPDPGVDEMVINELDMENEDLQLLARYLLYGWSIQALADEKGITVDAMKMRINRAKKRLRKDPKIKNLKKFYF